MFQFAHLAHILMFLQPSTPPSQGLAKTGKKCLADKQLKLQNNTYNPDQGIFAWWNRKFDTQSNINVLDAKETCLVGFTRKQMDNCKNDAWMCVWQKKHSEKLTRRNTKLIEPGWPEQISHCHGSGWSRKDDSDVQWKLRYETFEAIVCRDHGFRRGYNTGAVKPDGSYYWSCGCVENMPQVTRCDCSKVDESKANDPWAHRQTCIGQNANNSLSEYMKRLNINLQFLSSSKRK